MQPRSRGELFGAQVLEEPDFSLVELANEQMLLSMDIRPTGASVSRAFHPNGGIAHLETYRRVEVGSAGDAGADHEKGRSEQDGFHVKILRMERAMNASGLKMSAAAAIEMALAFMARTPRDDLGLRLQH
jgi:hypothetical protein